MSMCSCAWMSVAFNFGRDHYGFQPYTSKHTPLSGMVGPYVSVMWGAAWATTDSNNSKNINYNQSIYQKSDTMMEAERFLLKWNNHQTNLVTVFDQLYEQEAFTDVTLACDGRTFAAHKVILSACSPYFQALFLGNPCKHPIIFMRDVRSGDMEALLSFMYRGEINVHQHDLSSFLRTAESLQIKGLSDSSERHKETSKILEAMERKFCSPGLQQQHQSGLNACSNTLGSAGLGGSIVPSVGVGDSPPTKKFKGLDDLPRILPKMKPLSTPPGLVTPVPGLLTPITLAATVMKNAAHAAQVAQNARVSPPTPETTNSSPTTDASSPSKDRKKVIETLIEVDKGQDDCKTTFIEGYISGDSPHPVYLVSSVGGVGAATSGNSTPSHEVKVEEEDPLDDTNSFSDDPVSNITENDDTSMTMSYTEEMLGTVRDKLTYPCRYCGKRFTQTGTCRRHERLHTAPNSFKCPICQKGFNRKYRLKEHIVASHPHHEEGDISLMVSNSATTLA